MPYGVLLSPRHLICGGLIGNGSIGGISMRKRRVGTSLKSRMSCSHWGSYANCIRVIVKAALNSVTRRKEGVKSLNQSRIASKELRDSLYDSWSINSATLELLHYIKKSIVHIGVLRKLALNLVQVAESIVQDRLLRL